MSISRFSVKALPILPVIAGLVVVGTTRASVFTVASDGGTPPNGANMYAQSFSPSVSTAPEDPTAYTATPSPQPAVGATVYLTSFQFAASGTYSGTQAAGNTSTYLIIEDTGPSSGYANFSGLTPSTVTGVSTNTVDTTPADNTAGNPLVWTFSNLPVTYGDYLTAAMATISGSTITYIPADIQLVQYTEIGSTYYPDYNYGGGPAADSSVNTTSTGANYNAAGFYTYGGSFFGAGSDAEDATFTASFLTAVPEPVSAGMVSLLGLALIGRRRGPAL